VTREVAAISPAQHGVQQQQSGLLDICGAAHVAEKEASRSAIDHRELLKSRWSGGLARRIK
jgi:hypothetical protein